LDESNVREEVQHSVGQFHGLTRPLRAFTGARGVRVVHPAYQVIAEHRHDSACLTLHTLGSGREHFDDAEAQISGPSAVFHRPDSAHLDHIGDLGLETVSIEFDITWLRSAGLDIRLDRSHHWQGGAVGQSARILAKLWVFESDELRLSRATAVFLGQALRSAAPPRFHWLQEVSEALAAESPPSTLTLAHRLDLHPAWLARAYRAAVGEGMGETVRRSRVERAINLLRSTDARLADIAAAVGFFDQSHMNRCFTSVVARTPRQIRSEYAILPTSATADTDQRIRRSVT